MTEKLAIVLLGYGLATHLRDHVGPLVLAFDDDPSASAADDHPGDAAGRARDLR